MTNSVIPYAFTPGTKAKAGEVNANFNALAELIEQNKNISDESLSDLSEQIETINTDKADKTDLITEHNISESGVSANTCLTKGSYIFNSVNGEGIPTTIKTGVLIVHGDKNSILQQIWVPDGYLPNVNIRRYRNGAWGDWYPITGLFGQYGSVGWYKLPNGLILQWGLNTAVNVTYPIAYTTIAIPYFTKNGANGTYERSDTGINSQNNTGFSAGSAGYTMGINWFVIGY